MNESLNKTYRIISWVILGMCIYFFIVPLISPLMTKLVPELWTCPFLRITGQDCPFCGVTRSMGNIYRLKFGGASILSMMIVLIAMLELVFRLMVVLLVSGLRKKTVSAIIAADVIYHTLLIMLTSFYAIMYLLIKF